MPSERRTLRRRLELAVLLALLVVPAVLRFSASGWGVDDGHRYPRIVKTDESTFFRHFRKYPTFKPTYVDQTTIHALLLYPVAEWLARKVGGYGDDFVFSDYFIYRVGRTSSILAGLALLLLFLAGGRHFGLRTLPQRALAAGLLAFSPLISVYSHLFLADTPNVLFIWLAFLAFIRHAKTQDPRYAVMFALFTGFATATKLSVTYCLIPGLALLICAQRPIFTALMMAFVALGAFYLGNGFNYGMEQMIDATRMLEYVQKGGEIPIEFDSLINLRNLLFFLVTGLGIPVFVIYLVAAGGSLVGSIRVGVRNHRLAADHASRWLKGLFSPDGLITSVRGLRRLISAHPMGVIYISLIAQILLTMNMAVGGLFARHVIPFLPALVIVAVQFLARQIGSRSKIMIGAMALLVGYQVALCFDGERGYFNDPRQEALDWLKKKRDPKVPIWADFYSLDVVDRMTNSHPVRYIGPSPVPTLAEEHLFVLHQATYARYLLADSCDKIQHCLGGEPARRFFVNLIGGNSRRYTLLHTAKPGYVMPEHHLIRYVVPTHPFTDVGDVRIYRGKPSKSLYRPQAKPQPAVPAPTFRPLPGSGIR